jgi:hypothetical protein
MKSDPAFPAPELGYRDFGDHAAYAGMTLRDYFAAKAMVPLMSHSGGYWGPSKLREYAVVAYEMADAMLEERAK